MDVSGLPAHGAKQAEFGRGRIQGREFNARAQRSEAANDPASAELNERVGTADGAVDDGLIKDFAGACGLLRREILRPTRGRWRQRLGFPGDAAAVPIGDGNIAGVAEATESGHPVSDPIWNAGGGHYMFDSIDGADWDFGFQGGKLVHFLPETDGIAQFTLCDEAQPDMLFGEHEGAAFFGDALSVALEDGVADIFALEREPSGVNGKMDAHGQAHQIDGEGQRPGLVEVVDPPDQAAFDIAPGAEIFNV